LGIRGGVWGMGSGVRVAGSGVAGAAVPLYLGYWDK
jgi:hypothetical protein